MPDIDFYSAKPGDVCNENGDIRGTDIGTGARIIRHGQMFVTQNQAKLASAYGWQLSGIEGGLTIIERIDPFEGLSM